MLDAVKDALYRAITSPRGVFGRDSLAPIRVAKDLARRLNATLGSPLAPIQELARRRDALGRLAALRDAKAGKGPAPAPRAASSQKPDAAPVMVYFEKDRGVRELGRIEEALGAKGIAYKLLDVAGDEATLDFVMREAGCDRDELPVVFVGGAAIGNFPALVKADVSGELQKAVYGG